MLTNTATADPQDHPEITATTIAIEAAEARCRAALRDLARLADGEQISTIEAADLEADTIARLIMHVRALESRGEQIVDPRVWAGYEARAAPSSRGGRRRPPQKPAAAWPEPACAGAARAPDVRRRQRPRHPGRAARPAGRRR